MATRWAAPDPGLGAPIELGRGEVRGRLQFGVVGEALPGQGLPPEEPPPALDEVQPAGSSGQRHDVHAGMLGEPRLDGRTLVAGKVVGDQVEVALRVGRVDGREQPLEPDRVARGRGQGEGLPIPRTQGPVDPDLVGTTTLVKGGFDAMAIRRPARCWGERARAHRSELVEAEDRRSLRRVGREGDDPRSFGTNSGSVLSAQVRGCRHRTPSCSRMRRIWLRSTGIPFS